MAAVAVLTAAIAHAASGATRPDATAQVLPGAVRYFSYASGRAAWIDAGWTLHVRALGTGGSVASRQRRCRGQSIDSRGSCHHDQMSETLIAITTGAAMADDSGERVASRRAS